VLVAAGFLPVARPGQPAARGGRDRPSGRAVPAVPRDCLWRMSM